MKSASPYAKLLRMMTLAEYLRRTATERGSRAAFARECEISQSYLSELASGLKRPSLLVAHRIERATEGKVQAWSWLDTA